MTQRIKLSLISNPVLGKPHRGLTITEIVLCIIVIATCFALHFPAVHQFAWPIEIGLSLVSFATPISGMLYLSAAQVIPDPVINPTISTSMMAMLGFCLWQMTRLSNWALASSLPLLKAVAPYFLWCSAMTLLRGNTYFSLTTIYAIATGIAAATLVHQSKGRLMTCLFAFLLGQAIAGSVFWMIKLGLGDPVQIFRTELYGASSGEALRFGTARGNATLLGPSMAIVAMGVLAHWLIFPVGPSLRNWVLRISGLGLFLVVIPPLIGSGCRGAIVAVGCGGVFLLLAGLVATRALVAAMVVLITGTLVLGLWWNRFGLDTAWELTVERQRVESAEGGSYVAGRQNEWKAAALGVIDAPITGGGEVERLSYFDNPEMWASHCTYLDAGLAGGLPGMLFFIWFVLKPLIDLWHRRRDFVVGCFLTIYTMNAVVIATTSSGQVKHLWILCGLASTLVVIPMAKQQMTTLKSRKNQTRNPRAASPLGPVADTQASGI